MYVSINVAPKKDIAHIAQWDATMVQKNCPPLFFILIFFSCCLSSVSSAAVKCPWCPSIW